MAKNAAPAANATANPPQKTSKSTTEKRSGSPVPADAESSKKRGKAAFLAAMANEGVAPTRTLKSMNGTTPMVTVEAVVTSATMISIPGKKPGTTVPKLEVTAMTRMVRTNGAPDCVDSGIPGMAFLIPTIKPSSDAPDGTGPDDGPEAAVANKGKPGDGNKKSANPPRTLSLADGHKTVWLGFIKTSIYTTAPGGGSDDKDKNSTSGSKVDLDSIKPGAVVEITGNNANLGADGKTIWLNSSRITPLKPNFESSSQTAVLIKEFMSPDSALMSAFLASQCANGFFGVDFGIDEARKEQAELIHRMWTGFLQQTSKSCEQLALSIGAATIEDGANAKVLDAHATRLAQTSPADVANGTSMVFIPTMMPTLDRPIFCAPLVQYGKTPMVPQPSILMDLVEGTNLDKIPKSFASLDVREVEFQGAAINLKAGIFFVADKDSAIKRLEEGKNPILSTGRFSALGIRLNMRTFCGTLGTLVKAKAEMCANELLPDADIATVAKLSPKPMNSDGLQCCFPESFSVDMPSSIPKVAINVSEKWVQEHLCGGATQFVYEADADVPKLKEKDGRTDVNVPLPSLKAHGYQAISESGGFKLNGKAPIDKPVKKYFVLYEGCRAMVAEQGEYPTLDDGELAVAEAAKEAKLELPDFLNANCIVYCVAFAAELPLME